MEYGLTFFSQISTWVYEDSSLIEVTYRLRLSGPPYALCKTDQIECGSILKSSPSLRPNYILRLQYSFYFKGSVMNTSSLSRIGPTKIGPGGLIP